MFCKTMTTVHVILSKVKRVENNPLVLMISVLRLFLGYFAKIRLQLTVSLIVLIFCLPADDQSTH